MIKWNLNLKQNSHVIHVVNTNNTHNIKGLSLWCYQKTTFGSDPLTMNESLTLWTNTVMFELLHPNQLYLIVFLTVIDLIMSTYPYGINCAHISVSTKWVSLSVTSSRESCLYEWEWFAHVHNLDWTVQDNRNNIDILLGDGFPLLRPDRQAYTFRLC